MSSSKKKLLKMVSWTMGIFTIQIRVLMLQPLRRSAKSTSGFMAVSKALTDVKMPQQDTMALSSMLLQMTLSWCSLRTKLTRKLLETIKDVGATTKQQLKTQITRPIKASNKKLSKRCLKDLAHQENLNHH